MVHAHIKKRDTTAEPRIGKWFLVCLGSTWCQNRLCAQGALNARTAYVPREHVMPGQPMCSGSSWCQESLCAQGALDARTAYVLREHLIPGQPMCSGSTWFQDSLWKGAYREGAVPSLFHLHGGLVFWVKRRRRKKEKTIDRLMGVGWGGIYI